MPTQIKEENEALQEALQDAKNSVTENLQDDPFANIKSHAEQSQKRKSVEEEDMSFVGKMRKMSYHDDRIEADDDTTRKSSRRGKGNLYQQFMIPTVKKNRAKQSTQSSANFPHNGYCKPEVHPVKIEKNSDDEPNDRQFANPQDFIDGATNRRYDATNFNLDEKIRALPGLDLDEYLMKKKESKKKKKINSKDFFFKFQLFSTFKKKNY